MKFVKWLLTLSLLLSLLVNAVACGAPQEEESEEEEDGLIQWKDPSEYQVVKSPDYDKYAGTELVVYNWGEYIADGSDGYADIVKLFEATYGIKVVYSTFASNEEMFTKLESGAVSYDIIVPSEYMVGKLIDPNGDGNTDDCLLMDIDVRSLKNFDQLDPELGYYEIYDPKYQYSVPYTVGMVGILCNMGENGVSEEDFQRQSWDLMWDTDYAGNILNFDNPRDAMAIAQLLLGIDLNTTDKGEWDRAKEKLEEQRPLLQGYVMDEIFLTMEGGNALVAAYYAGDCLSMMEENPDLKFFYPKEGTNIFVDAMCVPKTSKNPEAAKLFMEFLMDPDIAAMNANYICYATPNNGAKTSPYYQFREDVTDPYSKHVYETLYNTPENYKTQFFKPLSPDMIAYYTSLFDEVKVGASGFYTWILPIILVACVAFLAVDCVIIIKHTYQQKRHKKS